MKVRKVFFALIKSRLLRLVETDYERHTRALLDYQQCQRGKKIALQLQSVWEAVLYEMNRVGLGGTFRELSLDYPTAPAQCGKTS
jgi:hypothetical protein